MMKNLTEYIYQGKNIPIREYIAEKLIINKDYKVTNCNSFTDADEIYVILFENIYGCVLLFNTYKVYDHDCDTKKSTIKFSSAVSIFNQWGISATSMYDKENDIAYIINKDSTYIIFSDNNIEKLELLMSLMKKLINTDYSIKSILDELAIDNGEKFIKTDMYQTYKFDKNDRDNEYKRTKAYLKQHLDNIKKKK